MMAEGNDMGEEFKVEEEENKEGILRNVVILTDQEVVKELEMETSIMELSRAVHGLYQWAGQSISVDSLVTRRDLIKEIVRE